MLSFLLVLCREMCKGLTGFPDETGAVCTARNMAPLVLLLLREGEVVDVTHVCKSPYWLVGRQASGRAFWISHIRNVICALVPVRMFLLNGLLS